MTEGTDRYCYDNANRLLSKTPDASFGAAPVTYTYNAAGRRATMTDASGTTFYGAYDIFGHAGTGGLDVNAETTLGAQPSVFEGGAFDFSEQHRGEIIGLLRQLLAARSAIFPVTGTLPSTH